MSAVGLVSGTGPASAGAPSPSGEYVGAGSGRCLTTTGTGNLSPAVIADCTGAPVQLWNPDGGVLRSDGSGRCLSVANSGTANGSVVRISDCNGSAPQKWTVRTNGGLRNTNSGRCLDVKGRATAAGSPLQLWDCGSAASTNQVWRSAGAGSTADVLDPRAILAAQNIAEPGWFEKNVPFLDTPDADLNAVYYYRWMTFKEHLRYTTPDTGYISTEFVDANQGYGAPYGGISAAAALHLTDGRWMRDQVPMDDYYRYWLQGLGKPNQKSYAFWSADALWKQYQVTGDSTRIRALLPDLVRVYRAYDDHFDSGVGLYASIPVADASEFTQSSFNTCDAFGGGLGFRPTLNSYQFADATAISRIATLTGDGALADEYAGRAAALKTNLGKLWDPAHDFYMHQFTGTALPFLGQGAVDCNNKYGLAGKRAWWREEMGFLPWQFGMAPAANSSAWQFLTDPTRFQSAYGPATIERYNDIEAEDTQTTSVAGAVTYTNNATASNGGYVGGIDGANSAVTFTITAPGNATVPVRVFYANATGATATHNLSVNGGAPISVSYPSNGQWGNFNASRFVTVDVPVKAGRNTLRFAKGTGFAELDRIATNAFFNVGAGSCCHWNGPSWPYQTSQTLAAMANLLSDYPAQPYVDAGDFADLMDTYVRTQFKDGHPYVAEGHDADKPIWTYDAPEHSTDYNHSTFMDNVITGLIGFKPATGNTVSVHPLVHADWNWFALEDLPYHGHSVSIRFDRDGTHYGKGSGLQVFVDGARVANAAGLGTLTATIPAANAPRPAPARANWASNPTPTTVAFPKISATYAQSGEPATLANDGKTYYNPTPISRWGTFGSAAPQQTLTVDFGQARPVDEVDIALYSDANCAAPQQMQVQYDAGGGTWRDLPNPYTVPAVPTARDLNTYRFSQVSANGVRVVLTNTPGKCTSVPEFSAWGPKA